MLLVMTKAWLLNLSLALCFVSFDGSAAADRIPNAEVYGKQQVLGFHKARKKSACPEYSNYASVSQ